MSIMRILFIDSTIFMAEKNPATKRLSLLITLVILIIIVGGVMLLISRFDFDIRKKVTEDKGTINPATYQAVFLSNGQVYFGHLEENRRPIFVLRDVYYLQIKENLQGAPTGEQSTKKEDEAAENESPFTLVKLGEELHQPASEMTINGEHILFWENLQNDSRIIQGINEYEKDKAQ